MKVVFFDVSFCHPAIMIRDRRESDYVALIQRIVFGNSRPHHFASRCTVAGEKAGKHMAMYSAPCEPGVL